MMSIVGLMGTALTGTALAGIFDAGSPNGSAHGEDMQDSAEHDAFADVEDMAEADEPAAGNDTLVLAIDDGPEAWFDDFTPGQDTLVVTYADGAGVPEFGDLTLRYDEDYDETEVSLGTSQGPRLVCYLPGVTPAEITSDMVEFMPMSEAAALLAA